MDEKGLLVLSQILDEYLDERSSGKNPDIEEFVLRYNLGDELKNEVIENLQEEKWIINKLQPFMTEDKATHLDGIVESAKRKLDARIHLLENEDNISQTQVDNTAKKSNVIYIEQKARETKILKAAAEDSTQEKEIESRLMHEFTNKKISFDLFKGEFLYIDMNSVELVFLEGDDITTKLDGCVIELSVLSGETRDIQINNSSAIIDFTELKISITDYAKVRYIIKKDGEHIAKGSLGDE